MFSPDRRFRSRTFSSTFSYAARTAHRRPVSVRAYASGAHARRYAIRFFLLRSCCYVPHMELYFISTLSAPRFTAPPYACRHYAHRRTLSGTLPLPPSFTTSFAAAASHLFSRTLYRARLTCPPLLTTRLYFAHTTRTLRALRCRWVGGRWDLFIAVSWFTHTDGCTRVGAPHVCAPRVLRSRCTRRAWYAPLRRAHLAHITICLPAPFSCPSPLRTSRRTTRYFSSYRLVRRLPSRPRAPFLGICQHLTAHARTPHISP